jgi:REP element-mobilizing transposase RayT
MSEPETGTPSTVMQVVKHRFARQVLRERQRLKRATQPSLWQDHELAHVWQARFYDFNVWGQHRRVQKLRYMHANPVKRGLVLEPGQWAWSSFRDYELNLAGPVKLNQWPKAELKRIA